MNALQLPETVRWNGDEYAVPALDEIEFWIFDSVCETPDGDIVEPDQPDSWLALLGLS